MAHYSNRQLIAQSLVILSVSLSACGKGNSGSGQSYSFTASASSAIAGSQSFFEKSPNILSDTWNLLSGGLLASIPRKNLSSPTLCSSTVCFTATSLTGIYYGTGFLIQSEGNGMVAYFGQDTWSGITGSSQSYSFDTSAPITHSGTLSCCGGTGDLSSANSYISDAIYLFGYLDATFTVSGVGSNTNMNQTFTVRFILADDAITGAKRGDLMLKDPADSQFKWMDTSINAGGNVGNGTLVTERPSDANTARMNTSVVNYVNPFGANAGNNAIPVIYAPLVAEDGASPQTITETALKQTDRKYTLSFDSNDFVMFPDMQLSDINMLYSYRQLLAHIHLAGLPHSAQSRGVGSPATTVLTITGGSN